MPIIFVLLLVFTIIFAFGLWIYLSHSIVVVVEDTAAGNETVHFADEPLMDWFWQCGYLAWTIVVWIAPASLFGRLTTHGVEPYHRPLYIILHAAAAFWVMFPLSLLSTMAAESRWTLLHFGLFQRLAKRLPSLLLFYLCSFLIVAVAAPSVFWLTLKDDVFSLLGSALALGAAVLLYSRLLGRLACLTQFVEVTTKSRRKSRRLKGAVVSNPWEVPEGAEEEVAARSAGFLQPKDLPALDTPDEEAAVGYDVSFDRGEPVPAANQPVHQEFDESMLLGPSERLNQLDEEERRLRHGSVDAIKPDEIEMDRLRRKRQKKPEQPLLAGVGGFLFRNPGPVHWVALSAGIGFLGLLIRGLRAFWPF